MINELNTIHKLCDCGCGKEVSINRDTKKPNKVIRGHTSIAIRKKLAESHTGKKFSEEHKTNLALSHKCKETQQKLKDTNIKKYGVESPMQSPILRENHKKACLKNLGYNTPRESALVKEKHNKTCIEKYGVDNWAKSIDGRKFARVNRIKVIEVQKLNGEPLSPCIGIKERECLNELQPHISFNIIRNDHSFKKLTGRFPDGHIKELKLFIQFDERHHFIDKEMLIYKEQDIRCTKDLESIPGYTVFRISEREWLDNKQKVIIDFKNICKQCTLPQSMSENNFN